MKYILYATALFFLLFSSTSAAIEQFDGSQPLLCASVEAIDCVSGMGCVKDTPESLGAPQFLKIDFAGEQIIGPKHTSPIVTVEKNEGQIILQGMELNMGWVFSLNSSTGKFSATLTDSGGAFVIFGACTAF